MSEVKKWRSTSPSQLSTFADCRRKWWRVSVNGERQPPTAAAERGSKIHAELEAYLMHGAPLSDGTARAMAQHLPFAGSVSEAAVEVAFTWRPDGWPVPIRGRVDLVDLARAGAGDVVVGITDHKTTGSLEHAKTERDLARDPQALLYSGAAFAGALEGVPAADSGSPLRFRLLYGTTRAPYQVREVTALMSSAGVSAGLDMLAERAHEQGSTAQAQAWADVEPSYSACEKYGGCPFMSRLRPLRLSRLRPLRLSRLRPLRLSRLRPLRLSMRLTHLTGSLMGRRSLMTSPPASLKRSRLRWGVSSRRPPPLRWESSRRLSLRAWRLSLRVRALCTRPTRGQLRAQRAPLLLSGLMCWLK